MSGVRFSRQVGENYWSVGKTSGHLNIAYLTRLLVVVS